MGTVEPAIAPAFKLQGTVAALGIADGESFVTRPVDGLVLDHEGIVVTAGGERHRGRTRGADARVPWYPRGVPILNVRMVSLVSEEDLADAAGDLGIPAIDPTWLGANLVLRGVPRLSMLPRGTRLLFPDGTSIAIEDQNAPCRGPGRVIASQHPGRKGLDTDFVKAARRRRGLVGWVERAGRINLGDVATVRVPEQWIYPQPQ